MGVIKKRLKFMAKYGHEKHRAELAKHVDDILKGPYDTFRDYLNVRSQVAADSELPLTDHQVHTIIDTRNPPDLHMTHPMVPLARWHFGDLKDDHWDKIARTAKDTEITQVLPHIPPQHLKTVFSNDKREPFVRKLAKDHHDRIIARDSE